MNPLNVYKNGRRPFGVGLCPTEAKMNLLGLEATMRSLTFICKLECILDFQQREGKFGFWLKDPSQKQRKLFFKYIFLKIQYKIGFISTTVQVQLKSMLKTLDFNRVSKINEIGRTKQLWKAASQDPSAILFHLPSFVTLDVIRAGGLLLFILVAVCGIPWRGHV